MDSVHKKVQRTVVGINFIESGATHDGIVMAITEHGAYVLTSDDDIDIEDFNSEDDDEHVQVLIRNQGVVKNVKFLANGAGIAILLCGGLTPDQRSELAEVELFEGNLQEFQEVYTYSHQNKYRVLTPGNIMSLYDEGFDHSCSAHSITRYGSPVFNEDSQLVGMCFSYSDYLSSYNIAEIAKKKSIATLEEDTQVFDSVCRTCASRTKNLL